MYITPIFQFACLIFIGKGRRRKIFNDENFMIYGIMDTHLLFRHASNSANSSMTGRSLSEAPKNNESRIIYPDGRQETRHASGQMRINIKNSLFDKLPDS